MLGLTYHWSRKLSPVTTANPSLGYYLLQNRQISGPYSVKTITDLNTGGLLNATTMCRAENSTEWISLNKVIPVATPP